MNWRRRVDNHDSPTGEIRRSVHEEGSWRRRDDINREERKVLIRFIPILKRDIGLVIGFQGANIKRLGDMVDVTKVSVDSEQCKVDVRAYTIVALDSVENVIHSIMAKSKIIATIKKDLKNATTFCIVDQRNKNELSFRSTSDCRFEILRFCSLFAIE